MNGLPALFLKNTRLLLAPAFFIAAVLHFAVSLGAQENSPPRYVGSAACEPCHQEEYASFIQYAKKSKSFQSIERLQHGLSREDLKKCYTCHTTGYGRPGGFTSVEETPELKNAGCEVCHGPGEIHIESGDIDAVKREVTREDCEACHISERVKAFRYKPLIHGGGH
ncbi:MAG: cytochrome c family protein [Desulfobulbaceae bacterium]|nr:cytochrome c family protein [Desulfobulbaceae bacterium]